MLGIFNQASAQSVPAMKDIPESINIAERDALLSLKAQLEAEKQEIIEKTGTHNKKCSGVEEGSSLERSCADEQNALEARISSYGEGVKKYNARIDSASAQSVTQRPVNISSGSNTYPVALTAIRGEFCLERSDGSKVTNKDYRLGTSAQIDTGTRITTGEGARVQIVFPNKTVFTVGANSDMVLDEFVFNPDLTAKKIMVNMTKGVFRWVTSKVKPIPVYPSDIKVKLPVGCIGIRGTDFEVTLSPDGSGSIVLYSGQLEITEKKTGSQFLMDAGDTVTIGADGDIGRPENIH